MAGRPPPTPEKRMSVNFNTPEAKEYSAAAERRSSSLAERRASWKAGTSTSTAELRRLSMERRVSIGTARAHLSWQGHFP